MKILARISKWIKNFLNNRKFYVAIDEEVSQEYPILSSVLNTQPNIILDIYLRHTTNY